jgi:glucosamine 6-phosphate synthetase-like amidotransferase/phosphosugar isomerase protein
MCGIAGSSSLESGFDLYEQNLDRGFYSSSVTVLFHDGAIFTKKVHGRLDLFSIPRDGIFYLFHSRGPTVETTEFKWSDNHPYTYGKYVAAHNGIIENFNDLTDRKFNVDSKVIPYLIDLNDERETQVPIISSLAKLKGTFAVWILNVDTRKLYIARHDITLFRYGVEFSSSNPGYMKEVPQDILHCIDITKANVDDVGSFELRSKPKYFVPQQK